MKSWILRIIIAALLTVLIGSAGALTTLDSPISPVTPTAIPVDDCSLLVAPNGGDYATIQSAVDGSVTGDVICVRTGTYEEQVWIQSKEDLTVMAYPGEQPVIDGAALTLTDGLLYVRASSQITLAGLTVRNSTHEAILVKYSDHISILGNRTDMSVSSGIGIWRSNDIVVAGNIVRNARYTDSPGEEHITLADVYNFEVRDNEVYQEGLSNLAPGIDMKESSYNGIVTGNYIHDLPGSGIYLDGWDAGLEGLPTLHNIVVSGNRVHNCRNGISVRAEAGGIVEDIQIFNNVLSRLSWCGINLSPPGEGIVRRVLVINNTVFESTNDGGSGIELSGHIFDIVLRNNVVAFGPKWTAQIRASSAELLSHITADHNLVWGDHHCNQLYPDCAEVPGSISGDPLFVSTANYDLHLTGQSPAIDAGSAESAPLLDFDGIARPLGGSYDIGAYEYTGEPKPTDTPRPTPTDTVSPTATETYVPTPTDAPMATATPTDPAGEPTATPPWNDCPGTPSPPDCPDCPEFECPPTPDPYEWWCSPCLTPIPFPGWGTPPAQASGD